MTNKLPVVGKRYRNLSGEEIVIYKIDDYRFYYRVYGRHEYGMIPDFWQDYEELPEDKAETKSEIQDDHFPDVGKMVLNPEVKEAIELMQFQIDHHYKEYVTEVDPRFLPSILLKVLERAKNLLNALDKQFANNKIQAKELVNNKIEEESIWKPVNELPDKTPLQIYIRFNQKVAEHLRGTIKIVEEGYDFTYPDWETIKKDTIEEWCSVSDLTNDHEKLKERVRKLENDR